MQKGRPEDSNRKGKGEKSFCVNTVEIERLTWLWRWLKLLAAEFCMLLWRVAFIPVTLNTGHCNLETVLRLPLSWEACLQAPDKMKRGSSQHRIS